MVIVQAVYLCNIPNDKTVQQLTVEFIRVWPDTFSNNNNFIVNRYQSINSKGQQTTKVVITGINVDFGEMERIGRNTKIYGHRIIVKPDSGEQRLPDGSFVNPKKGCVTRRELERFGSTQKKVTAVFKLDFLNSIGYHNLRLSDRILYVKPPNIQPELLMSSGEFRQLGFGQEQPFLKLQYVTVIGAMQAVASLNGLSLGDSTIHFFSSNDGLIPTSIRQKGLGFSGVLKYKAIVSEKGYIPFSHFDSSILDWLQIQRGISSLCWKCDKSYQFLGIDPDLNYLTGICVCVYDQSDTEDEKKAYQWANDKGFTRLMVEGKQDEARQFSSVTILHEPMQNTYSSPQYYAQIVLPILQEEWFYMSKSYREFYSCSGRVSFFEHIETAEIHQKLRDIYAVEVIIPRSPSWNEKSKEVVKHVTLFLTVEREGIDRQEDAAARLYQVKPFEKHNLTLCFRLFLPVDSSPSSTHRKVQVKPKPDKTEFKTTTVMIRKWAKWGTTEELQGTELDENEIDQPFLESYMARIALNWYITPIMKSPLAPDYDQVTIKINASLNPNQLAATQKAVTHKMSYIQGPPGTGKTQVAAAIVLSLAVREPGMIVVTAASNEACNCLADRICDMSHQLGIAPSVIRIMAPSKEQWNIDPASHQRSYPQLHDAVRTHDDFYRQDLQQILDLLNGQNEHSMTELDKSSLHLHINYIEQQIIQKFKILVCTLGSLSDRRVVAASKLTEVSTLIIEEAGQVTQPQTLPILMVKPKRIVVIGDHQQLPPTVLSPSAKRAGLADSMLLMASINFGKPQDLIVAHNPGWTTLTEQHRMDPAIRNLVSAVTYRDMLTDAPVISTRPAEILPKYLRFLPELQNHAILLFDESGFETIVGTSYKNTGEAIRVAGTVTQLLKGQTPPTKITVLSFYDAQKKEIRMQIELERIKYPDVTGYSEVRVCNVDAYQGRENSLVIVSFVRSNQSGDIGFAREPNRLNVAISRARTHLIIVCNVKMFREFKSQVWETFIDKIEALASIA